MIILRSEEFRGLSDLEVNNCENPFEYLNTLLYKIYALSLALLRKNGLSAAVNA